MMYKRLTFSCLIAAVAVLTSACGGGGSAAETDSADKVKPSFSVALAITGGGAADPLQQQVTEGETATVELQPESGFRVGNASGCNGSLQGSLYRTGPITADCQIAVEFIPAGAVSGQLLPAPSTAVDTTVNDRAAALGTNTTCDSAQPLDKQTALHGFAAAAPTGGDLQREHFADAANVSDFYKVTLTAGQMVELEVVDYQKDSQELELHLWNGACSRKIDSDDGETAQVSSLLGGSAVVEVKASAGQSKYVLRVTHAWSSDSATSDELIELAEAVPGFVPDEVIIELEAGADSQAYDRLSQALLRVEGMQLAFRHSDTSRASLAQMQAPPAARLAPQAVPQVMDSLQQISPKAYQVINNLRLIDFIKRQPGVRHAEPNYLVAPLQKTPNDSNYSSQWHYKQIALPDAWGITDGARDDGIDVIVAVLDTGVYLTHEDLSAKVLPGYDFHAMDADPDEINGVNHWHGTHVAGTVAASSNNGKGVAGVSWAAKIMPVRVLGDEGGSRYDVIQGVRYAAGLANDSGTVPEQIADVINMSLGGGGHSQVEQSLYQDLRSQGVFVVAAAGNDGSDQPMYPAAYDAVVSVSASNCESSNSGELASYSNYGPTISLAAPGGDTNSCGLFSSSAILSTMGDDSSGSRVSSYGQLMGTSMASPHVAGVIALMRAVYPELMPSDFEALLADGQLTNDYGTEGRDDLFGYGEMNALAAVQAAEALRNGSGGWSARVIAQPASLYLGQLSQADLTLHQEGEGEAPAVLNVESQADWLTVTAVDVDAQGLGDYRVTIDRSDFADDDRGEYSAEAVFTLEGDGELRVPVYIQVGYAAEAAPIYVMLLDAASQELKYQVLAEWSSAGELHYSVNGVEPGIYQLVAGSDIDADTLVCQPGETCGAYPTLEARETVTVAAEPLENIDIGLDILSRFRSFAGSDSVEAVQRQ